MKSRQPTDDTDEEEDLSDGEAEGSDLEDEKGFVFLGFDVDLGRRNAKEKKAPKKKKPARPAKPEPEVEKVQYCYCYATHPMA